MILSGAQRGEATWERMVPPGQWMTPPKVLSWNADMAFPMDRALLLPPGIANAGSVGSPTVTLITAGGGASIIIMG